jgi:hypothetical protein
MPTFRNQAHHNRNIFSRTSERKGHWQTHDSSAAFDPNSLNESCRTQAIQIGGTSS